jgi:hypothetical protein
LIFYRCFPRAQGADPRREGGPLWFPRPLQGDGRHDNPDLYGCLYVSESDVSVVVEQLARFRGADEVVDSMLVRGGSPLTLVSIGLPDETGLVDLDDPRTLVREALRPSQVATHDRHRTQRYAAALYGAHAAVGGIRWWSTFEASWPNVTLFDRIEQDLVRVDERVLTVDDQLVEAAAEFLGLR